MNQSKLKVQALLFAAVIVCALLFSCATAGKKGRAYPGGEAEMAQLGLSNDGVEVWEDGMRTNGGPGTFEWWYFDAKLDDGSAVVIVFYTKSMLDVKGGLAPSITVKHTRPDGTVLLERSYKSAPSAFSASKELCDVRIG